MVKGQFEQDAFFGFRSLVAHPCLVFFLGHNLKTQLSNSIFEIGLSGGPPFNTSQALEGAPQLRPRGLGRARPNTPLLVDALTRASAK